MRVGIGDYKPKDKSKKRQRKRELEFKVLSLFENEGLRYRRNLKESVAALKREPVEIDKSNQQSFIKQQLSQQEDVKASKDRSHDLRYRPNIHPPDRYTDPGQ